jgi:hypothetical protein
MHLDILKFVRCDKNVYKLLESCRSNEGCTQISVHPHACLRVF